MKAYVTTTGILFGLITVAHVLRIIDEWPHLATDPWYLLLTAAAATLCLWAWRLLRARPERDAHS
jgi:protein-S-isoprenylcysteine O-methyltransferase Ste14